MARTLLVETPLVMVITPDGGFDLVALFLPLEQAMWVYHKPLGTMTTMRFGVKLMSEIAAHPDTFSIDERYWRPATTPERMSAIQAHAE